MADHYRVRGQALAFRAGTITVTGGSGLNHRPGRDGAVVGTVAVGSSLTIPVSADVWSSGAFTELDFVEAPLPVAGGSVLLAGVGDGVADDLAMVNALLAGNAGKRIVGQPGATYLIGGPIVVPSLTSLDLTGCTVRLAPGVNGNMLVNAAVSAARSVIDGALTLNTPAGKSTLTSATAAFMGADVGKTVCVVDAGANGRRFVTTIQSVTNATTAVLAANATIAVTSAWVTIGARDQDITIIGGTWDRGANGQLASSGYSANSLRLRRVDNLKVIDVTVASTAGKYSVSLGDVWDFHVSRVRGGVTYSDVVHVNGPAKKGVIRDTRAALPGDDVVSLTCSDFTTYPAAANTMADVAGDIDDVLIDGVDCEYGATRGVLLAAGTVGARAMRLSNIRVRNVRGKYLSGCVWIGGDPADTALQGGNYDDIEVDGVSSLDGGATGGSTVFLWDGTMGDVTLRNIKTDPGSSEAHPVQVGDVGGAIVPTIARLTIDGVRWRGGGPPNAVVTMYGASSIDVLTLSRAMVRTTSSGVSLLYFAGAATVNRFAASDSYLENAATGGNVSSLVYQATAGAVINAIEYSNIVAKNVNWVLGYLRGTVRIKAVNVRSEAPDIFSGWLNFLGATAAVTVESQNLDHSGGNGDFLGSTAGCTFRSLTTGLRGDASNTSLAKNVGDMIYNTNAALTCGVGPVGYTGTAWKNLITAATF